MIEGRIVIAQSDAIRNLGIAWGGGYVDQSDESILSFAGDSGNTLSINNAISDGVPAGVSFPGALLVDLGVAGTSGFSVGFTKNRLALNAELSALESEGSGEVVSQPKVITGDKQEAYIKSGTEIPYQEASASGATSTSFKEAVPELKVTPSITPDDRVMLRLEVTQDSVGTLEIDGPFGCVVPTIDATELSTQVLVGVGATVVLGGIFKTEAIEAVNKVPFFGDIPYIGAFFRNQTRNANKTETLIFITPRILAETLLD